MAGWKKMDPAVKAEWVAALRSGKYRQATEVLATLKNKRYSYCCLGVLCALDERVERVKNVYGDTTFALDDKQFDNGELPNVMLNSIGLSVKAQRHLIKMNDDEGASFEEIADWIETHL